MRSRKEKDHDYYLRHCEEKKRYAREYEANHRTAMRDYHRRYAKEHVEDMQVYWAKRRRANPQKITAHQMVACIRLRTRKSGVRWDSERVTNDYVEALLRASPRCGMCGTELDYGPKGQGRGKYNRDNSPSLDRFVPELGYVEGNLGVLCHKCNTRKNDHTLDSALLLIDYLTRNASSIGRRAA